MNFGRSLENLIEKHKNNSLFTYLSIMKQKAFYLKSKFNKIFAKINTSGLPSTRIRIAFSLLIVLCFHSNLQLLKHINFIPGSLSKDDSTIYDDRLKELKEILPSHGVVSYITNKPFDPNDFKIVKPYYLTQYTLTPLIVVISTESQYIIGDFHAHLIESDLLSSDKVELLKDFGNGVMLFGRKLE